MKTEQLVEAGGQNEYSKRGTTAKSQIEPSERKIGAESKSV